MSFVKVAALHARHDAHVRYTPDDWRLDVLQTDTCQICGEPATFHADETAECVRCGFWFDGLVTGVRRDDAV